MYKPEDIIEFENNAVKILEDNSQYATARAVERAFMAMGCVEQFRWERNIALEMLEDLGLGFAERTDDKCVISKEEYEELKEYKFMYTGLI
jgi:hypothetical protein